MEGVETISEEKWEKRAKLRGRAASPADKNINQKLVGKRQQREEEKDFEMERTDKMRFTPVSSVSLIGQSRSQQRRSVL